jgi:DUF971 family protein
MLVMALKKIPVPEVVELADNGARIVLRWPGNRITEHAALDLRTNCPCAVCVDEMTGKRLLDPGRVPPDVRALGYARIGRYALQFTWSDGHTTGIYPYVRLYSNGEDNGT